MKYYVRRNFFSPMCGDWQDNSTASHALFHRMCNFNCKFCCNNYHDANTYVNYTEEQFVLLICNLLKDGSRFKFSGGEPTLDPQLSTALNIIHDLGGFVFLDTNGSVPTVIERLIDKKLIDVIGISLKGVSRREAMDVSQTTNGNLCWDNVLKSIELASFAKLRTIVTYVFWNNKNYDDLERFSDIISPYKYVYLKVNNLLHKNHHEQGLKPIEADSFDEMCYRFIESHPEWRGKMIVVNKEEAITNYEKIIFL